MKKQTTIQISEETWRKLRLLQRLGETFDSVINRLINDLQNWELQK